MIADILPRKHGWMTISRSIIGAIPNVEGIDLSVIGLLTANKDGG